MGTERPLTLAVLAVPGQHRLPALAVGAELLNSVRPRNGSLLMTPGQQP